MKTIAAKQGSKTVIEYANMLQHLWHELGHYRVIQKKCLEDVAILKNFIEKDRVYDFLVCLNAEFDQVRIQILGREDVQPLNEVIALIRAEESRRGIMLELVTNDASAMIAKDDTNLNMTPKSDSRDYLWCTYYKKPCHTKDNCWKIRGKLSTSSREWGQRGESKNLHLAHQISAIPLASQRSIILQHESEYHGF